MLTDLVECEDDRGTKGRGNSSINATTVYTSSWSAMTSHRRHMPAYQLVIDIALIERATLNFCLYAIFGSSRRETPLSANVYGRSAAISRLAALLHRRIWDTV